MRSKILAALPWPVQVVVGNIIYRKVTRNLQGQGIMAFTEEEISEFRQEIWASLNAVVAEAQKKQSDRDRPFWVWGGEGPTEVDAGTGHKRDHQGVSCCGRLCETDP
ncbi:uncharacterized protein AFUA_7G05570 [Aspergillus fumigatus Af293]|uniref:Uncharacterized protein n=1 Tax=Aspergillus fumigatus (strain ATCC MYA-4609 / CBS 101355 / FGSC A1100 / Af293) TaxID=330879 RepID=Q4WGM7_ASPFU|nr:hypothetical protein AFUA_7G05570 [Aspergillus fumigatus Af293]EAL86914.1 hypothetical protein AFUA_7G05570 [Aspergillus fumigatus Af293]